VQSIPAETLARTTLITLGDNGSSRFGLRKGQGPPRNRIKHTPYEGGVRVPMIVNGPHVAAPGTHTDALVHIADILPTVAELAGMPMTDDHLPLRDGPLVLDGRSILPLIRGEATTHHALVYGEVFEPNGPGPYDKDARGIRNATHRLVVKDGEEHFFRLGDWWEEGPDLLEEGVERTADDEANLASLRAALADHVERLVYEGR
jgi:arylsulfatase